MVVIILGIVMGLAVQQVLSSPDRYRSTALVVASPQRNLQGAEYLRALDLVSGAEVKATYADLFSSSLVVDPAMDAAGIDEDSRSEYRVRVTTEPESSILRIVTEGPDRQNVIALNEAVEASGTQVGGDLYPLFQITSLEAARGDAAVVSLSWFRALVLAGVIGLGLGVLVALWVDSLLQYRRSNLRQSNVQLTGTPTIGGASEPT